jgi:Cwf15/Cwc15 cell cycle control protein
MKGVSQNYRIIVFGEGKSRVTIYYNRRRHRDALSDLPKEAGVFSHCTPQLVNMSTAHRPTWDPAQAKDVKGGSRQFSVRDMAAHTKLKFRCANFLFRYAFLK